MTASAVSDEVIFTRPQIAYDIVGKYTEQHMTTFYDMQDAVDFVVKYNLDAWTIKKVVF